MENTRTVIDWFKNIGDKKRFRFIPWDIVEFYPNITEDLLNAALDFAKQFLNISYEERKIILQAKQSLLYDRNTPWMKKGNSAFNVGMGSWDVAS